MFDRPVPLVRPVLGLALSVLVLAGGLGLAGDAPKKQVRFTTQQDGDITRFFARNLETTEVTATFDVGLVNLRGSTNFPYTRVLAAGEEAEVFQVWPEQTDRPSRFCYTNYYTLGSSEAVHDDDQVYQLPYEAGRSFRVTQGYHGSFSHSGPDEYAIDWKMPEGTPVLAARAGLVVATRDDSSEGGSRRKYLNSANYVLIRHADGTLGQYGHLLKGSNQVCVGQQVVMGEVIGRSGNTGFTSGPHLHFGVFKAKDGHGRETVPIRFRTGAEEGVTLVSGQSYTAPVSTLAVIAEEKEKPAADGQGTFGTGFTQKEASK